MTNVKTLINYENYQEQNTQNLFLIDTHVKKLRGKALTEAETDTLIDTIDNLIKNKFSDMATISTLVQALKGIHESLDKKIPSINVNLVQQPKSKTVQRDSDGNVIGIVESSDEGQKLKVQGFI
jgi:hypothetical protein